MHSIKYRDILLIWKLRVPSQIVHDVLDAALHLLGAKSDRQKEIAKEDMTADFLKHLNNFDINSITYSDMKYLQTFFEIYPDSHNVEKSNEVVSYLWYWLNGVYRKRLP